MMRTLEDVATDMERTADSIDKVNAEPAQFVEMLPPGHWDKSFSYVNTDALRRWAAEIREKRNWPAR